MSAGLSDADQAVSPLVRKAAAWSWRLLVIFAAVFAVLWVIQTTRSHLRSGCPGDDGGRAAASRGGLHRSPGRSARSRGCADAAVRLRGGGRHPHVRGQPVRRGRARARRAGRPQHRGRGQLVGQRSASSRQRTDPAGTRERTRSAAQQSGEADQRGAFDGGHSHRDRHRRAAHVLHADLPAARRAQHLRVRHQGLPRARAAARARRRPGRVPLADRLRACDVPRRARRRGRYRHRSGHHGHTAGACRWRHWSFSARSSRWSAR